MKLIRQKHKNGCAVACTAMVLDISYHQAMRLLHPKRFWWFSDATTYGRDIFRVLEEFHLSYTEGISPDFHTLPYKAIIFVKLTDEVNHGVVWCPESKSILDPAVNNKELSLTFCIENFKGAILINS